MGDRAFFSRRAVACLIGVGAIAACLIGRGGVNTAPPAGPAGDHPAEPPSALIPVGGDRARPAESIEPFPLELAFSRRQPFSYDKAAISPTGGHIAYTLVTPVKKPEDVWTLPSGLPIVMLGARIHVTQIATGKSVPLGADRANSFSPAWAPDGNRLAYYSDDGGALRAWVYDAARGTTALAADVRVKVHLYTTTVMPPTWSPDGRCLLVPALPADEAGADPRPPHGRTRRAPQSATGPLVLGSGGEPVPPVAAPGRTFSHYDAAVDLTTIDTRDGSTRVLLPAKLPGRSGPAFARYSPTGHFMAYVSHMRPGPPVGGVVRDVLDVGVVKVGDAEPVYVEEVARYYEGYESHSGDQLGRAGVILTWHPTDDVLLFVNDGRLRRLDCAAGIRPRAVTLAPGLGNVNGDYLAVTPGGRAALVGLLPPAAPADSHRLSALGLVPLNGDPARKLSLADGFDGGQVVRRDGVSIWQPVADTATFIAGGPNGSGTLVRRVDLAGGGWATVRTEPETIGYHGMPTDGAFLVGTVQGYARPPDFYRLGPDFAPRDRLSTIEPRLEGQKLGPVETFRTVVPLHDGRLQSVRTAVLLPPGAKRGDRRPAVVTCYGGSDYSRRIREYGGGAVAAIPAAVFTSRGFAVVMVDAPLGPEGRPGQPAEELRDVVLPQVYRAAEQGYIDIERVAVAGYSYGGYCAAALVSTTNLFRAAVAISGSYDLGGNYGVLRPGDNHPVEWSETGQGRMGQPPWSDIRRYLDNSPYYRADRVRTPLLIVHGRDDNACRVEDAEKMFSALRRLSRPAQLAVYDGEGHWFPTWERRNATDAAGRVVEFLQRHLGTGGDHPR